LRTSKSEYVPSVVVDVWCDIVSFRFIASAGTYANLVRQAKSKQKIIDKMEAAGLIEKIETPKPLRYVYPSFTSQTRY
jgi:hypothetical protein